MKRACALLSFVSAFGADSYFPPPDAQGGWRKAEWPALNAAFDYAQSTTRHGGLLVVHKGTLVYERYFGRGHAEATPSNASIGKSFTSIAAGILMAERPDLFPDGLDQKVWTPKYLPPAAFPLSDPRKSDIRLGQLLAMTAGIRGNNPGYVHGKTVQLDPAGPDGWLASVDEMAFGRMDGNLNARTLWCDPGGGYSYATSSPHIVSAMVRHVSGKELEAYVREKLADLMGWGRSGWGYRTRTGGHTSGGGGIAPRPADMVRFGYLLLRGGRWGKRQLVPADYVRAATHLTRYNPHFDYSLQFDVNGNGRWPSVPRDAFWKTGSGGFCLYVIPSRDLVVYKMGGRDDQYSDENTGTRDPRPYDGSRNSWSASRASDDETYARLLEMIIEALPRK